MNIVVQAFVRTDFLDAPLFACLERHAEDLSTRGLMHGLNAQSLANTAETLAAVEMKNAPLFMSLVFKDQVERLPVVHKDFSGQNVGNTV